MLDALFGNRTAASVLLFIALNREAYAQEIADRTRLALNLVQAQLRRLEAGNVLVSQLKGRTRLYSFNPRWPLAADLQKMLQRGLEYLPERDREAYLARRRPRATGKPL